MQRTSQKTNIPRLQTGEQIILQSQGAYKHNFRSGWKVARCVLTNQRLIMYQGPTIRFQIPIDDIRGLAVERLHYVLRKRESLSISYNVREGSEKGRIWFVVNDFEKWRERIISQTSLLTVNIETIQKIAAQLDADGRDILLYLWENHYARIDQLAELIEAPSHMHVLMEIRETINPVAEKIVGIPILSFERAKKDDATGKIITYSWWIIGKKQPKEEIKEPIVDIFDEGYYLSIILELMDVREEEIKVEVIKNKLSVFSNSKSKLNNHQIPLPFEVKAEGLTKRYNNNLLEIKVHKA